MSKTYNEKTRVQMPAMIHLTRLGYQYIGKLYHIGTDKNAEHTAGTSFDETTNILHGQFQQAFARLNPSHSDEWAVVLEAIKKELNDDDLGKQFYTRLTSISPYRLIDF